MTNGHAKYFPRELSAMTPESQQDLKSVLQHFVDASSQGVFSGGLKMPIIELGFSKQSALNIMRALRLLQLVQQEKEGTRPKYRLMFDLGMPLDEVIEKALVAWRAAQEPASGEESSVPQGEGVALEDEPAVTVHWLVGLYHRRGELQDDRDNLAKQLAEADAALARVDGAIRDIDLVLATMPVSNELGRLNQQV